MVELINSWGSAWTRYFGFAVAQNTIFLAILFLAFYLLRNAPARIKYKIAMVGLIKLLLPPLLPAPFLLLFSQRADVTSGSVTIGPITGTALESGGPLIALTVSGGLFLAWLLCGLISILTPLVATTRLKSKLRDSEILQSDTVGVRSRRRSIQLCQSKHVSLPITLGIRPDRIYLPAAWKSWPSACRSLVLGHECAHIERRDAIVQMMQTVARAVYFFHPLVWLLNARINEYREMACDDAAIARASISPLEYSRYLVHLAEDVVRTGLGHASVSALIRQKNRLLKRVNYQMQEAKMRQVSKITLGIVLAVLIGLMAPLSLYYANEEAAAGADLAESALEQSDTGTIEGTIKDQVSDQALPGANILVVGTKMGAASDREGHFTIVGVPPGIYQVKAQMIGYTTVIFENVRVKVGIPTKLHFGLKAQVPDEESVAAGKFIEYDTPPEPVGGYAAVMKNLEYPELARKAGIQGRVQVRTVIDEKGNIVQAEVSESIGQECGCDEAAVEAVKKTKWKPATLHGKPIKVEIAVPVMFKLDSKRKKVEWDTPPEPVGGYTAVQRNLIYPELARKAGVEGTVVVTAVIGTDGNIIDIYVEKPLGNTGCNMAALEAVKKTKWKPAELDGKPIKAEIEIPVVFRLK